MGQTISPPQRSAPGDLASTSYSLDPASLPRDLSPYSQRDLDRAMVFSLWGGDERVNFTGIVDLISQRLCFMTV